MNYFVLLTYEIIFVDAEEAMQQDHAPLVIFVMHWMLVEQYFHHFNSVPEF